MKIRDLKMTEDEGSCAILDESRGITRDAIDRLSKIVDLKSKNYDFIEVSPKDENCEIHKYSMKRLNEIMDGLVNSVIIPEAICESAFVFFGKKIKSLTPIPTPAVNFLQYKIVFDDRSTMITDKTITPWVESFAHSNHEPKTYKPKAKYRSCPFCGEEEIFEAPHSEEIVCHNCGAQASKQYWNKRMNG
jgi:ribosomal protein S27AE